MSNFKERRENIKKLNNQLMNKEEEVSVLKEFFQQENKQKEREKQNLSKYQGHLCDDYSIDDIEKKFQIRKERVFELIKEMKNDEFYVDATNEEIGEYAIMELEKEQELRDLEQFKDFIISCLEEDAKNGYIVKYYDIESMNYAHWKEYWINNKTPSLRGFDFRGEAFARKVTCDTSVLISLTTPVSRYGIFCTPEYKDANNTEKRKNSREVPITSILSNVHFDLYESNLYFLSKLISEYGEQKEFHYCEDTGTSDATYILEELLEITVIVSKNDIRLKVKLI